MEPLLIVESSVIAGAGRGKDLEVPTINLDPKVLPPDLKNGIYAALAEFGDKAYQAAVHIGPRPVFNDPMVSCEVHIINSDIPKAPDNLKLSLIKWLREVRNFDSEADLTAQMHLDIASIKEVLDTTSS